LGRKGGGYKGGGHFHPQKERARIPEPGGGPKDVKTVIPKIPKTERGEEVPGEESGENSAKGLRM